MSGQSRKLAQSQIWHILLLCRISETALPMAESTYQTADRGDGRCINPILVTLEEAGDYPESVPVREVVLRSNGRR